MDVTNFTLGKYFVFNNTPSYIYRLVCSGGGTYSAPKRAYDTVSIPGRNGSLLLDKGYYGDATVKYDVAFFDDAVLRDNTFSAKGKSVDRNYVENAHAKTEEIKNWLYAPMGYKKLTDTWHPGEFRLAYVSSDFDPDMLDSLEGGTQSITFTCKPQRFLDTGMAISTGTSPTNPSSFEAIPKFKFTSSGTLNVRTTGNDGTVYVFKVRVGGACVLDCDLMDAYVSDSDFGNTDNYANRNNLITYIGGSAGGTSTTYLPKERIFFGPGTSTVSYTGSFSYIPRWWRL